MVLFAILLLGLILFGLYTLISIGIKGIACLFAIGDILICIWIISIIVKCILGKKGR